MDETKVTPVNRRRKVAAVLVFLTLGALGLATIFFYVGYKATHISTDDAYIHGSIHTLASKVPGTVKAVHVSDNQQVKKNDLLVEIDAEDYQAKLREAESAFIAERAKLDEEQAKTETARIQLRELTHAADAARANLQLQEAQLLQAEKDVTRAENLLKKEAISKERFEKTLTLRDVAVAQVRAAAGRLNQAEAALSTQKALISQTASRILVQESIAGQKEAALRTAELNAGYTRVMSPSDGFVTKKSVETGNQVQAGQPLMAVVPLDDIWIIANYKETQLSKIQPGQKVEIEVDTYPGRKFPGRVDSIMAGTGSVFSLFPPENATGNFVKVVQRIPVKILLDGDADPGRVLRIGMSVRPTVLAEN